MQIVDAQIHLWEQGIPGTKAHRQVSAFTAQEAIQMMDEAGVAGAVIHPPPWDPTGDDVAFRALEAYPGRFAILAELPLDKPDSRARIATWRDRPGMLGLRYIFLQDPWRTWLADGTLDWLWAEAEKASVPSAVLATASL